MKLLLSQKLMNTRASATSEADHCDSGCCEGFSNLEDKNVTLAGGLNLDSESAARPRRPGQNVMLKRDLKLGAASYGGTPSQPEDVTATGIMVVSPVTLRMALAVIYSACTAGGGPGGDPLRLSLPAPVPHWLCQCSQVTRT